MDHLPPNLKYLRLGERFKLSVDHLPSSLTHLTVNAEDKYAHSWFNRPVDHLPESLTHLTIDSLSYDHGLDYLPASLIHLSVELLEQNSLDCLPGSLISLVCRARGSLDVDHLPTSLKSLFVTRANSIDHLPSHLTHLKVSRSEVYADHLPGSLTHLEICDTANSMHFDHLPVSLKSFRVGLLNSGVILCHLPPNLEELRAYSTMDQNSKFYHSNEANNLPSSLKILEVYGYASIDAIPESVTTLAFQYFERTPNITSLPPTVVNFTAAEHRSHHGDLVSSLTSLPPGLKSLSSEGTESNAMHADDFFPKSITSLTCYGTTPLSVANLPLLVYLQVSAKYPFSTLSPGLSTLILGQQFNEPIDDLPNSLKYLEIGNKFNHPLAYLPPQLTHLWIGNAFDSSINLPSLVTSKYWFLIQSATFSSFQAHTPNAERGI